MRNIGINLHAIEGLSDEDYVKLISSLGFDATFTLYTAYTADRKLALSHAELFAKYGLAWETIHAPYGCPNDFWKEGEVGEEAIQEQIDCVDLCASIGVPISIVHLSSGMTPPPTTDVGRARIERLINHATKKGVTLAFENQRKLFNLAWVFDFYGNESSVGFCWDTGHEACFTARTQYMPFFGKHLCCTHIHDNYGVFNQDCHMLPFDGSIDFDRVARQIRESGFSGSLMLECIETNSDRYVGFSPEEYLNRAADAVKKLRTMVDGQ